VSKFRTTNIWRTRSEVHFTNDRPVFVCEETDLKISLSLAKIRREKERERCRFERICHYVPHQLEAKKPNKGERGDEQKQTTRWIEIEREEGEKKKILSRSLCAGWRALSLLLQLYTMQARLLNTFRVKCASFSLINETCIGECDAETRENTFENNKFFSIPNEMHLFF
jgi:hypothetical protein